MKIFKFTIVILAALMLQNISIFAQGIAINDDGTDANSSAILDVKSSNGTQGVLMPRVTEAQKNAISSPATSLVVYQTDGISGFYFYNGTLWEKLSNNGKKYPTIAAAEAASGSDNDLCYVTETETYYRYEASASSYTDDNKYILSTNDGGDTRWFGVAGKFNLGDVALIEIEHLDATSGSASIVDFNEIYYIDAAATTTTVTIPDATITNEGWYLRLYKSSGDGEINIKTVSGQNIDGASVATIRNIGKGFYIKSDNGTEWLKIQDSRKYIPTVLNVTSDYGASESWNFDFMKVNTNSGDINVTLPADISSFPEGSSRMFFNTGTNLLYGLPNGNVIDGSTEKRVISPGGYIELQKINGLIKIVREKNLTLSKQVDEIANLECWLDASTLSGTDGSSLASWSDLSGNGNNFTSVNAPTLQTSEQNGKNVVRFDGINDVMSAGDKELYNNTRGFSMIAVVKATNSKRMPILTKYLTTGDNRQFAFGNRDNFLFEDLTWGSYTGTVLDMGLDNFAIVEYIWEPGKAFQLYINGVLLSTGDAVVNDISDGTANLKLGGGDYTSVGFWEGDFAEIMVYSEAVPNSEREALRANLAVKWDIDAIIIANGGAKFWQRDDDSDTIFPDVANDNLDIGTGDFYGGILNASELINAPALSTAPASPQAGSIYFDTNDSKLKVWTGSAWENLN